MANRKFLVVDISHLYNRAKFVAHGNDMEEQIGMVFHIILHSIKLAGKKFNTDHVVIACDGRSWRKEFDKDYKANRAAKQAEQTPKEREDNNLFFAAFDEFKTYLKEKTNCTVLHHMKCEADDFVAAFIQSHPDDHHILVSGDTDFYQLLAPNVTIFDGLNKKTITLESVIDEKNKVVLDKKTKLPLKIDPEYSLFLKIIRGDGSDNVFSAFPGVRETKLIKAYADRHTQGYEWCNLMSSRWKHHSGVEYVVRDRYAHNQILIDLTKQPDNIKQIMAENIAEAYDMKKSIPGRDLGFSFMKLCSKYNLEQLGKNPTDIIEMFKQKLVIE